MRIKNYRPKPGEALYLFDCVISGEILATWEEWETVKKYLKRAKFDHKFTLGRDLERGVMSANGRFGYWNVRVSATEKVVKRFGLTGYKKQNYMFVVELPKVWTIPAKKLKVK